MDLNRLTRRSQEALHEAQSLAVRQGHDQVEGEHLLAALLDQAYGILPAVLRRMEVSPEALLAGVEKELSKRPRVSGPGAETRVSRRLHELILKAED